MSRVIKSSTEHHRYEMVDCDHYKFWEYKRVGNDYVAVWGRIGKTPGGSKIYSADEINKLVREKIKKGYVHV